MSKQDRQAVRTARDIETKYNLGRLKSAQGSASQEIQLSNLIQTLNQFMANTNAKFEELGSVEVVDTVEKSNMSAVTSNAVDLALAKLMTRIERLESGLVLPETNAILGSAKLGTMVLGKGA